MDIDIVVDKARFRDWLDVSLVQTDRNGEVIAAARDVMFDPVEDGKYIQPTFHLTRQYAQRLMDELWRCGLRPAEGIGSVGALSATERHLADMQKIAFSLLSKGGAMGGDAS